jgi:hypothetical protein
MVDSRPTGELGTIGFRGKILDQKLCLSGAILSEIHERPLIFGSWDID